MSLMKRHSRVARSCDLQQDPIMFTLDDSQQHGNGKTLSFQKRSPETISITPVMGVIMSLLNVYVSLRHLLLFFSCVLQTEEPHHH